MLFRNRYEFLLAAFCLSDHGLGPQMHSRGDEDAEVAFLLGFHIPPCQSPEQGDVAQDGYLAHRLDLDHARQAGDDHRVAVRYQDLALRFVLDNVCQGVPIRVGGRRQELTDYRFDLESDRALLVDMRGDLQPDFGLVEPAAGHLAGPSFRRDDALEELSLL